MSYVFEIATVLTECLFVHIFFNGWFGVNPQRRKLIPLVMVVFFLLQCLISIISLPPAVRMIMGYVFVLCVAVMLYNTTKTSSIYSAFLFMSFAVASEYLCLILLNGLGYDVDSLMAEGNVRIVYLVIAKSVQLVIVLIVASVLRKNRTALTFKQVIPLLPCLIVSIYICVVFFGLFPEQDESLSLILLLAVIGLLYINGIIVFYTQTIKRTVFEAEEQKIAMQNYEMQTQHYKNVLKNREETRTLWHDLKKYITAIEALVESGNNQSAKSEYEQIRQAYDKLTKVADTGNTAIDAILSHNILRAKAENISVKLDAYIPPELQISAVDFSIIIGNTFDNAIEECSTILDQNPDAKPRIAVSIVQMNDMLFYEITNPCAGVPRKKPGKVHGYGLQNVRRCVDKYGGFMINEIEEGHYRVFTRLNCTGTV